MNIKKVTAALLLIGIMVITVGCGQKDYYTAMGETNKAINKQNIAAQKARQAAQQAHEARMTILISQSITAASQTPEKTDDVLVPLLIMSIEDKRIMAEALTANSNRAVQFQSVEAPESAGEFIRNSTGAILGVGAIFLGITNSNNTADIAKAGISGAGNAVSITGDGNSYRSSEANNGSNVVTDNSLADGASINNTSDASTDYSKNDDHTDNSSTSDSSGL